MLGYAQSSVLTEVLREIEGNNETLRAMRSHRDSKKKELQSTNNLPDPQFIGFYLPWGEHETGNYTEFQLSQSLEFPTVYSTRKKMINQQAMQLELEYQSKRQALLLQAKRHCLELIYLNKQIGIEQERMKQAQRVLQQAESLYTKGEIGILDHNKAKVTWLQEQFQLEKLENTQQNLQRQLQSMNGGKTVTLDLQEYVSPKLLERKDSLWQKVQENDPALKQLEQQQFIAEQQLKLSKGQALPDLTAGFNRQGIDGAHYAGIYAGISIPLWSSRNKVKAAKSNLTFQEHFSDARKMEMYTDFEKQYHNYQSLYKMLMQYEETLSGLDNEALLLQAYELGEISFLEYYMELQFHRKAVDKMLEMEHQLYQVQNELLRFTL
ncbi:TolC family protein [Algivirga pacifica]|uniref:TolC family protein n=2 Tax=Algivirga pacifica TaxID=1162670 RepID=A0ABP9D2J4_9BACT